MMKKMISMLIVALMTTTTMNAQSAIELAKQQQELNNAKRKMLNAKPTKEAKKQAKEYKKEGWQVLPGDPSIEQQIYQSQLYDAEYIRDENGNTTKRYISETGMTTSGSLNSGKAQASAAAMEQISSLIKTQITASISHKIDNSQISADEAITVDKFHQRAEAIVSETLTNSIPLLTLYRRLPNNNFEVMTRIAFDKKELMMRLKRNMRKELEMEGDKLNSIMNDVQDKF